MTDAENASYLDGRRRAWIIMLQLCLQHLGVDDPVAAQAQWVMERQETVAKIRALCRRSASCQDVGTQYWGECDYLPDIIERHLVHGKCYNAPPELSGSGGG